MKKLLWMIEEEAAEVLNKYFSLVFTLEDLGNIPEPKQTCLGNRINVAYTRITKCFNILLRIQFWHLSEVRKQSETVIFKNIGSPHRSDY